MNEWMKKPVMIPNWIFWGLMVIVWANVAFDLLERWETAQADKAMRVCYEQSPKPCQIGNKTVTIIRSDR